MDANMSDLISGVFSNPDALNKVKTLLPLVSQMLKSDEAPVSAGDAILTSALPVQPVQSAQSAQPGADIMANENVAAAVQNLLIALSSAQINQANQNAAQVFAQQPQTEQPGQLEMPEQPYNSPVQSNDSDSASPVNSINIEKTLNTLKNVTAVANPENDHRAKLLLSLKPFMNESRQTKIDTAIKYINAAKILTSFGKNGFVKS